MPMLGPTHDHEEIRRWAAIHGATPVEIALLKHDGEPTKIAFMFLKGPKSAPEMKPISWANFFALFDLMGLSFVYDETRSDRYELLQSETGSGLGFEVGA